MNKEERNFGSILLFVIIILAIAIGGYYLIHNNNNQQEQPPQEEIQTITNNIKKDNNKEYIYFTNEQTLSDKLELIYKDINININSDEATNLEQELNTKMSNIKNKVIKYSDTTQEIPVELITDNIYQAEMIDYTFNATSKYLCLITNNYTYTAGTAESGRGIQDSIIKYYVFDLKDGHILTTKDILNKEKLTDQEIRGKIREYLNNTENVDIDTTLSGEYQLGINNKGNILINIIVKTNDIDYNIEIEMD